MTSDEERSIIALALRLLRKGFTGTRMMDVLRRNCPYPGWIIRVVLTRYTTTPRRCRVHGKVRTLFMGFD